MKKNTILPVTQEEETSFGVAEKPQPFGGMTGLENPTYNKSDIDLHRSGMWHNFVPNVIST